MSDVTRDRLANERTYLAWLRTAANVMVIGLAMAKFVEGGSTRAVIAGAFLVCVGAVGIVYAAIRYRANAKAISEQRPDVATGTTGPVVAGALLLICVVVALVLVVL